MEHNIDRNLDTETLTLIYFTLYNENGFTNTHLLEDHTKMDLRNLDEAPYLEL